MLDSEKLEVPSGLQSTLSAQTSSRPCTFADSRSRSDVQKMWTDFGVSTIYWILIQQSERKTLHTRFTFLSVVDLPERGSSATSPRPSLNAFCHFPNCNLEMQSSLKQHDCFGCLIFRPQAKLDGVLLFKRRLHSVVLQSRKTPSDGGTSFRSDPHRIPGSVLPRCVG